MPTASPDEALPSLTDLIEALATMREEHIDYFREAVAGQAEGVCAKDHLVIAALRRSLDNISGFLAMVDQRNIFCGVPIIRFQLDTAMSLFARTFVADVFAYAKHIAEGKERRKYLDRHGRRLTDSYLHKELTKKHDLVTELYSDSSGYVHFSTHHMHRVIDIDEFQRTGNIVFKEIEEMTAGWNDEEVKDAVLTFLWATDAILAECADWRAARRAGNDEAKAEQS